MACWRLLELSSLPDDQQLPQILIKADFSEKAYSVFITDLTNIWSEDLSLDDIIKRASSQDSPIEVSTQDTTQLGILLKNVEKSLGDVDDTVCCVTQNSADIITLHTTIRLPEPLDALKWKFDLVKRTAVTLKNELILPLLLSSHLQHERVSSLLGTIGEKDRAIARLLDQYESSNLDLAAAFPSIAGSKAGRRVVKREQAIRHIPALGPFREEVWKEETGRVRNEPVSSLSLFQEALSECTVKVPPRMKSQEDDALWWTSLPTALKPAKLQSKPKAVRSKSPVKPKDDSSEEETEDEFEIHDHFKTRDVPKQPTIQGPLSPPQQGLHGESEGESTEEEDLDAPALGHGQINTGTGRQSIPPSKSAPYNSKTPEPPSLLPTKQSSPTPKRAKGFRIGGGKAKQAVSKSPSPVPRQESPIADDPAVESIATTTTKSKTARKPFKIGGKQKEPSSSRISPEPKRRGDSIPPPNLAREVAEPSVQSSRGTTEVQASTLMEEEREETAEEKAERRRQLLKRNMEEQAKKQAQKKKRRF